jgi:methylated-DNA-protein-cysteine methyltransferase related protein
MARAKKSLTALMRPLSPHAGRLRRQASPEENPAIEAIWQVIATIPRGAATTYGEVARAAGYPGRARLAGYALRNMIDDIPWYRVVGAGGRIAFPAGTAKHREQAKLLRSEGVVVKDGRVNKAALIKLLEGAD